MSMLPLILIRLDSVPLISTKCLQALKDSDGYSVDESDGRSRNYHTNRTMRVRTPTDVRIAIAPNQDGGAE